MIYTLNTLKTLLEGSTIASAAGVGSMTSPQRVFIAPNIDEFIAGMNIGRLPIILIKDASSDYEIIAQPDHQSTRTASIVVRLVIGSTLNNYNSKYDTLQRMKTAIIKSLMSNTTLGSLNYSQEAAKIIPYGLILDLIVSCETSSDNSLTEE